MSVLYSRSGANPIGLLVGVSIGGAIIPGAIWCISLLFLLSGVVIIPRKFNAPLLLLFPILYLFVVCLLPSRTRFALTGMHGRLLQGHPR